MNVSLTGRLKGQGEMIRMVQTFQPRTYILVNDDHIKSSPVSAYVGKAAYPDEAIEDVLGQAASKPDLCGQTGSFLSFLGSF